LIPNPAGGAHDVPQTRWWAGWEGRDIPSP